MHSSFFIITNFEIWVYKEMKIHFLLETLGFGPDLAPYYTTIMSFLDKRNRWYYGFWGIKWNLFQYRILGEKWSFFNIYEICMIF